MRREAAGAKAYVQTVGTQEGAATAETTAPPSASAIGAARASAKLAHGIFLTYSEHKALRDQLFEAEEQKALLEQRNIELMQRLKKLERLEASLAKVVTKPPALVAKQLRAAEHACERAETENATPTETDRDARGKSPGVVRQGASELFYAMTMMLSAVGGDGSKSPSFKRGARRLSGGSRSALGIPLFCEEGQHSNASPVVLVRPPPSAWSS